MYLAVRVAQLLTAGQLLVQRCLNKVHALNASLLSVYHPYDTHEAVQHAVLLEVPLAKQTVVYSYGWVDLYFDYLLSLVLKRRNAWYIPMHVRGMSTSKGVVFVRTWDGALSLESTRESDVALAPDNPHLERCLFAMVCNVDVTHFLNMFDHDLSLFTVKEMVVILYLLGYIKEHTCVEALYNEHTKMELIATSEGGGALVSAHLALGDLVSPPRAKVA